MLNQAYDKQDYLMKNGNKRKVVNNVNNTVNNTNIRTSINAIELNQNQKQTEIKSKFGGLLRDYISNESSQIFKTDAEEFEQAKQMILDFSEGNYTAGGVLMQKLNYKKPETVDHQTFCTWLVIMLKLNQIETVHVSEKVQQLAAFYNYQNTQPNNQNQLLNMLDYIIAHCKNGMHFNVNNSQQQQQQAQDDLINKYARLTQEHKMMKIAYESEQRHRICLEENLKSSYEDMEILKQQYEHHQFNNNNNKVQNQKQFMPPNQNQEMQVEVERLQQKVHVQSQEILALKVMLEQNQNQHQQYQQSNNSSQQLTLQQQQHNKMNNENQSIEDCMQNQRCLEWIKKEFCQKMQSALQKITEPLVQMKQELVNLVQNNNYNQTILGCLQEKFRVEAFQSSLETSFNEIMLQDKNAINQQNNNNNNNNNNTIQETLESLQRVTTQQLEYFDLDVKDLKHASKRICQYMGDELVGFKNVLERNAQYIVQCEEGFVQTVQDQFEKIQIIQTGLHSIMQKIKCFQQPNNSKINVQRKSPFANIGEYQLIQLEIEKDANAISINLKLLYQLQGRTLELFPEADKLQYDAVLSLKDNNISNNINEEEEASMQLQNSQSSQVRRVQLAKSIQQKKNENIIIHNNNSKYLHVRNHSLSNLHTSSTRQPLVEGSELDMVDINSKYSRKLQLSSLQSSTQKQKNTSSNMKLKQTIQKDKHDLEERLKESVSKLSQQNLNYNNYNLSNIKFNSEQYQLSPSQHQHQQQQHQEQQLQQYCTQDQYDRVNALFELEANRSKQLMHQIEERNAQICRMHVLAQEALHRARLSMEQLRLLADSPDAGYLIKCVDTEMQALQNALFLQNQEKTVQMENLSINSIDRSKMKKQVGRIVSSGSDSKKGHHDIQKCPCTKLYANEKEKWLDMIRQRKDEYDQKMLACFSELQDLSLQNQSYESKVILQEKDLAMKSHELVQLNDKYNNLVQQNEKLNEKLKGCQEQMERQVQNKEFSEEHLKEVSLKQETLKARMESVQKEAGRVQMQLENENVQLKKEVQSLIASEKHLYLQATQAGNANSILKSELAVIQDQKMKLQTGNENLAHEHLGLQKVMKDLETELICLQNQQKGQSDKYNDIAKQNKQLENELRQYSQNNQQLSNEIRQIRQKLQLSGESIGMISAQRAQVQGQLSEAQDALRIARSEVEQGRAFLEQKNMDIMNKSRTLAELKLQYDLQQEKNSHLVGEEDKWKHAQTELIKTKQELNHLQQTLSEKIREGQMLLHKYTDTVQELSQMKEQQINMQQYARLAETRQQEIQHLKNQIKRKDEMFANEAEVYRREMQLTNKKINSLQDILNEKNRLQKSYYHEFNTTDKNYETNTITNASINNQ